MTKLDLISGADRIVRGYLAACTFVPYCENDASPPWLRPGCSHDPNDRELAKWCSLDLVKRAIRDCDDFATAAEEQIGVDLYNDEEAGVCFMFNRDGHGAGFQDDDWNGQSLELKRLAQCWGEVSPMYWGGLVRAC